MVDWSLARRIARLAAGQDRPAELDVDLRSLSTEMELHVAACTRLELAAPAPPAELLTRAEWAAMNLGTFERLLDPVIERLEGRLALAGPLAGALRLAAGATVAAEAGLVMGYMSQRILGQYELSLLAGDAPPRLVFVAPNLANAVDELDVERESFFGWIAIHELTHVFQFQGVPWLRDHLAGLIREYVDALEVRAELPDVSKLVAAFREGGLAALVQTGSQRELMGRINCTMAVVEGYSEYVMDELGSRLLPAYDGLREAMDKRRRSRSAPERMLQRLLGLEMKMRQYVQGRAFCDAVVAREGMDALNSVWGSPEAMPSAAELEHPEVWLERIRTKQLAPGVPPGLAEPLV
jgi:coenzyme F420 biosynthesis associated uncharacterized protein